jgi:hypothetical protein
MPTAHFAFSTFNSFKFKFRNLKATAATPEPKKQPKTSPEYDQATLRGGLVFVAKFQHKYG